MAIGAMARALRINHDDLYILDRLLEMTSLDGAIFVYCLFIESD